MTIWYNGANMETKNSKAAYWTFTAVFAALAAFVFWGTWSTRVAPVMPDDAMAATVGYGDVLRRALAAFLESGKLLPTDLFWKGLVVSPYFCQELKYVSALYLAGLALAWFLRGRGLGLVAAYGAGLLLAFCGYWSTLFAAGHGGWFIWMSYGVFAFGLIDRALAANRPRHWLLLGAVVAWGSFYQSDLWLLFTCLTAAYFVFRWTAVFRDNRAAADGRSPAVPLKGMALALAACALVGAPGFYSAIFSDLAARDRQIAAGEQSGAVQDAAAARERRWEFVTNWSLPPEETAEFFWARKNGDTSCPLTLALGGAATGVRPYTGALGRPLGAESGNYRQHSLYVGWMTCLLALLGFAAWAGSWGRADRDLRRTAIFFAAVAALCTVLSFGRYCECVYRVVFALPMGDYLRAPVKWHHLTEFSLVVLAGLGIEFLARSLTDRRWRWLPAAAVLWGAVDLARNDRLYCAPQPHNYAIQLVDARAAAAPEARRYLSQQDLRVLGSANGIAAIGKYRPPAAASGELPRPGLPFALGLVSVFSALAVAAYAARRR